MDPCGVPGHAPFPEWSLANAFSMIPDGTLLGTAAELENAPGMVFYVRFSPFYLFTIFLLFFYYFFTIFLLSEWSVANGFHPIFTFHDFFTIFYYFFTIFSTGL